MNDNDKKRVINKPILTDWALYLYLIAMLGVYPVITDNKYFNITITRYRFFMFCTAFFAALTVVLYIANYFIYERNSDRRTPYAEERVRVYKNPIFWVEAFVLSQFFAWILSPDKKGSFTGETGRHLGLLFFIVVAIMCILIAMRARISELILMLFAVATGYAYIIAVFQHMGNDFMGYKDGISQKQYDIFVSTLGNINIFASFLCISIPVFVCVSVFSARLIYRIVAMLILALGGMCIMIANSDSAYMGIGAAMLLIFFLAYKDGLVQRFILSLFALGAGNLGVVLLNHLVIKEYDRRGGVAEATDRIDLAVGLLVVIAVLYVLVHFCAKRFQGKLEALNKKKVMLGMAAGLLAVCVAVVCFGIHTGASLFTFNYKWGTYRGYIWTKCAELFAQAPMKNKLFGYGNETVRALMEANYHQEMLEVTGKTYDNAHNELLQYLVTSGIAGVVSYIGLFVCSFACILKKAGGRVMAYVSAAAMLGYFVQGLINVNQPITTPFFFLFMALGVGYVRDNGHRL